MLQRIMSAWIQMMACHTASAKLLSEPMLGYCLLDPKEQTTMKF